MIDLLLGGYNYLIKPRLQDLEGHRVSSQERRKDRTQILTGSRGTLKGKGPWGCVLSLPARVPPRPAEGSLSPGSHHPLTGTRKKWVTGCPLDVLIGSGTSYISFHGNVLLVEQEITHLIQPFLFNTHMHREDLCQLLTLCIHSFQSWQNKELHPIQPPQITFEK